MVSINLYLSGCQSVHDASSWLSLSELLLLISKAKYIARDKEYETTASLQGGMTHWRGKPKLFSPFQGGDER